MREYELSVNNIQERVSSEPDRTLLDVLRDDLGLTGTKRGCNIGACGSCTVLVDGKPRRACRVRISDVARECGDKGSSNPEPEDPMDGGRSLPPEAETKDGNAVSSLIAITTIEGLGDEDGLHPIQQAFIDRGAIQCGFCTPGMVLTVKALLDENPDPTREEIKDALRGNLCRCTGYQQIFEAVETAAKRMKGKEV